MLKNVLADVTARFASSAVASSTCIITLASYGLYVARVFLSLDAHHFPSINNVGVSISVEDILSVG